MKIENREKNAADRIMKKRKSFSGAVRMMARNLKSIYLFQVLLTIAACVIALPLINSSIKYALRICGYSYLTPENLFSFLRKPITIGLILFWLLIIALFEYIIDLFLIIFFRFEEQKQPFKLERHTRWSIRSLKHPIKRGVFFQILISFFRQHITGIILIVLLLSRIPIPNYIFDYLQKKELLLVFLVGLEFVILCLSFETLFVLPYCFLEGCSTKEAIKKTKKLLKGNRLRTIGTLVVWNLILAAIIFFLYIITNAISVALVMLLEKESLKMARFLSIYEGINIAFIFMICTAGSYISEAVITHLFYCYKEERKELTYEEKITGFKNQRKGYQYIPVIFGILLSLVSLFSIYNIIRNGAFQKEELLPIIGITSHRGSSKQAPENTLPALEKAIEQMADYAEIDVRLTKDNYVILMHDSNLKRITGINRKVASSTLQELRGYDVGGWFSKEYKETRVPTLEEVLQYCKGRIKLNIEIKADSRMEELVERVLEIIEEYHYENQCVITSTSYRCLQKVKEKNLNIKTGYIMGVIYGDVFSKKESDFFSIKSGFIDRKMVEKIHNQGKEVHAWTVNSKSEVKRLRNIGVDNIITDNPVFVRETIFEAGNETFTDLMRLVFQ